MNQISYQSQSLGHTPGEQGMGVSAGELLGNGNTGKCTMACSASVQSPWSMRKRPLATVMDQD